MINNHDNNQMLLMIGEGISPVGLLETILFLIPGLAGVKVWLRIMKQSDRFNRIDTIGLSFGFSLLSMGLLYVCYSYREYGLDGYVVGGFLSVSDLEAILDSPSAIIGLYLGIMSVSISIGAIIGVVDKRRSAPIWSENRLWEYYFKKVDDDEFQLRVATIEGTLLEGRIDKYGESVAKRDIVLKKPRTIRVTEGGEIEVIESWTGSVYVHNQDISYVMIDELPDAEEVVVESSEGAGEEQEATDTEVMFDESTSDRKERDRRQDLLSRYKMMGGDAADPMSSNRVILSRVLSPLKEHLQKPNGGASHTESGTDETTSDKSSKREAAASESDESPTSPPESGGGTD